MDARGIPYPAPGDRFTAKQMAAVAAMLSVVDRRSEGKRLADLGITVREFDTWLLDEHFSNYLRDRSERLLSNTQYAAHMGLVKGARNGNIASIKYMNEMTGRFDPAKDAQVNVQVVMHQFIEVIQEYVKDPITLHKIASKMSSIASRANANSSMTQTINVVPLRELKS